MKTSIMMKKTLFILAMACSGIAQAQTSASGIEQKVRLVADRIIQSTSFKFINLKTGEKYDSTKGLAPDANIKAESIYNKWMYVNGVLTIGMMQTAAVLNDTKYSDYSLHNFRFIFGNLPYFEALHKARANKAEYGAYFGMGNLDACGAMSAGLCDADELAHNKAYRAYLDRAADYISRKQLRLPDGTLARPNPRYGTIWADDLFMSVPFLARMGKLTGDTSYFNDAIKQVENFNKYLYDERTGLFFHNYYFQDGVNGVAHWGRANGWLAMAQAQLLDNLPANYPKRAELIKLLLRQIIGFSRYQDQTGLWHQLLDKPDSYLETSVTAMFTYTVAHAVNRGWINAKYLDIARQGWKGLVSRITADGEVEDVCIGTNMEDDINFYYTRPKALNDPHGLGPFLLAGTEMIKAMRNSGNH